MTRFHRSCTIHIYDGDGDYVGDGDGDEAHDDDDDGDGDCDGEAPFKVDLRGRNLAPGKWLQQCDPWQPRSNRCASVFRKYQNGDPMSPHVLCDTITHGDNKEDDLIACVACFPRIVHTAIVASGVYFDFSTHKMVEC